MAIPENILLDVLAGSLDKATRNRLELERDTNPQLTFHQFWRSLVRDFDKDLAAEYREEWDRLKISSRLTVAEWRLFQAQFDKALARVPDLNE